MTRWDDGRDHHQEGAELMARGRKRPPSRLEQQTKQQAKQLLSDWAALTWIKDGTKLGPIPLVAFNWVALAALAGLLYLGTPQRLWTGIALAAFLLFTIVRAGAVMPRRRKAVAAIYAALQKPAALPRSSGTTRINPESYISVTAWGRKAQPSELTVTVGADSPATTSPYLRTVLEKAVEKGVPSRQGNEWLFAWPDATHLSVSSIPADDPRIWQRNHDRKMARVLGDRGLFDAARNAADYDYELTVEDRTESERGGTVYQFPTQLTWSYGGYDATDPQFRERVTAEFDRQVRGPGVWVYDWSTEGELTAELVADDDLRARRKIVARKITSDIYSMIRTNKNTSIDCEITKWMPEGKRFPDHFPVAVTIDFGTLNLGDRRLRNKFEEDFDTATEANYPGLTWLYDWTPGGTTRLDARAVPSGSAHALRKITERTLRNVIESQFNSRQFVDCDVLDWQPELAQSGMALPQTAQVNFGAVDMSNADVRGKFEDHWSSQTHDCDWNFDWSRPGFVTMYAVPSLPKTLAFPERDSDELREHLTKFREGKVYIGPKKGGGHLYLDLNGVPHGLIGGRTGAGKSVTLNEILYMGIECRDSIDLVVCDPKRTDFTWTPEFPNVKKFAATEIEICEAIGYLYAEMDKRRTLLSRCGVENLRNLRRLYAQQPELEAEHGPVPNRCILVFDEIGNWWMAAQDEDVEEAKKIARNQLIALAQLARAVEINMFFATQKPGKEYVATQLKENCGFRLCVGPVDQYTSDQILGNSNGTRFPSGSAPKGRAWATIDSDSSMVQVPYLPLRDEPCPWDPSINLNGLTNRARTSLTEAGYQQIMVPNAAGGTEPRWAILDEGADTAVEVIADTGQEQEPEATVHLFPVPDVEFDQATDEPTPEPTPELAAEPEPASRSGPRRASRAPGPAREAATAASGAIDSDVSEDEEELSPWS